MKTALLIVVLVIFGFMFTGQSLSAPLNGQVAEEQYLKQKTGAVIDSITGKPISNATVSIPSQGISVQTDGMGRFSFGVTINGPTILSVQADGYKPFSLTVNQGSMKNPVTLEVSKQSGSEIVIDNALHHLGDDNYSKLSADAGNFKSRASGSLFSKGFNMPNITGKERIVLRIGSIVGLDTMIARRLGQSNVTSSYSSPMNVYLNSQKISELKINGDNQEVLIPAQVLKPNAYNEITIETGYNQFSPKRDFDDMEFMNLILEFR